MKDTARQNMLMQKKSASTQFVTIGVPTYNSASFLPIFLSALKEIEYPGEKVRLVFVDNDSTDGTLQLLEGFALEHRKGFEKIIVLSQRSSIPEARNLCIENSVGEFILFLDSDVIPPSDTIRRMLVVFAEYLPAAIVGFSYQSRSASERTEAATHTIQPRPYAALLIQGGCTMIRLGLFSRIGRFNTLLTSYEDLEFSSRAFRVGYLTLLDPVGAPIHLGAARSKVTPHGIAVTWRFIFSSIGKELLASTKDLDSQTSEPAQSKRNESLIYFAPIFLGRAFWKVASRLSLLIFFCLANIVLTPRRGISILADAAWFSWLGVPVLAAMIAFFLSVPRDR